VIALLLAHALQTPTAKPADSLMWDYALADLSVGPVTTWLVCLDGQATANCATVLESSGVAGAVAGDRTYAWKIPALPAGLHTVTVQACTNGAAACSSGASLAFTVQLVLTNPKNLRLGSGR
jgi:hypothetical protein